MTPLNAGAGSPRPGGGNGQERLSAGEKEEEFPPGKPRERSSPSTERPNWTLGIPLAATRLRSSGRLRPRPMQSLDCTMNEGGSPKRALTRSLESPWTPRGSQLGTSLKRRCFSSQV